MIAVIQISACHFFLHPDDINLCPVPTFLWKMVRFPKEKRIESDDSDTHARLKVESSAFVSVFVID